MKPLALEINDAGLTVASPEAVLAVEPGYAVVASGEILTGTRAYSQARMKPHQSSNSFWSNLSTDTQAAGGAGLANTAELAFAQLREIWRQFEDATRDVVLVVPGHYESEQLGLLLGMAQELKIPVRAMVDVAVAASERPHPGRQLLYVDAGLHRASVTPLEQGREVTALPEQGLEGMGLAAVLDGIARRIGEIFVLATRFDPFHEAASEQRLYDRLHECLESLRDSPRIETTISFGAETFTVELERSRLLGAAAGFYKALVQLIAQTREGAAGVVVQLSDRLARLPGMLDAIRRIDDAEVVVLGRGHAAQAALKSFDEIDVGTDPIKLFRHFPWREQAAAPTSAAPVPREQTSAGPNRVPTHVVYRGVAYPVNGEGLVIGRSKSGERRAIIIDEHTSGVSRSHCELVLANGELRLKDTSSYGTYINERRASGEEVLRPADVIRIGSPGAEIHVVMLERDGGS